MRRAHSASCSRVHLDLDRETEDGEETKRDFSALSVLCDNECFVRENPSTVTVGGSISMLAAHTKPLFVFCCFFKLFYNIGENMNQEKLAKLQAQVRIGGKVS